MRRMAICSLVVMLTSCVWVCVLVAGEQSDKKDASLALRQAETLDEFERATIEAQENRRQFIRSL
ncbi:MAG: hypothetical protein ACYS0H_10830, partial [Planctomycetota bacterium]